MRNAWWIALAIAGLPSAAAAQARPEGSAELVSGEESVELAALRAAEQELFGGQPIAVLPDPASGVRLSDGPPAATSDVSGAGTRRHGSSPSRDLSWLRGLTLPDIPVRWDERVVRYLEYFRDDPRGQRHIRSWLRRVDRYGPTIRRTLARQGLPRDLIFVAMVESGFDPNARSHAGAAGMWQFVRATGEELGLTVNHWIDLRRDPERATEAAGRYLTMLHERFGTWELAFAAYNMGYGALLRAIRKYNTNDYWALAHMESGLPFETNLYVSKIVACAIIAHNRARFGLADLELETPVAWDTVQVPGGIALGVIARAAGTDAATIRGLNPAFRRGRTPPGGRSAVHIPEGSAERFARAWSRRRGGPAVHRPHTMRFGETLADLARDRGTSVAALRELNELGAGQRVGVGMVLLVPVASSARARRRDDDEEPPVVAVPEGPRSIMGRRRVFYRAARGDRVEEVARFFRVRASELRAWNGIDPHARLQSGMFLQIFVPASVDLSRALVLTPDEVRVLVVGSEEFFAYHEAQSGRLRFRYAVRSGDTLSEIAQRFGIRTASLARINQIRQNATIHPGDELIIYAEPSRVPAEIRRRAEVVAADESAGDIGDEPAPGEAGGEPAADEPGGEPAADAETETDEGAEAAADGGAEPEIES